MRALVYLIGEPGVGKSTLMAAATAGHDRYPQTTPLRHDLLVKDGIIEAAELGARRGTFSGTDALPMNAVTKAEEMLRTSIAPVLIGEGARLGVRRFLEASVAAGRRTTLVYLTSPHAAAQRAARGTGQKDSWVKGAATRAANLAAQDIPGVTRITIDGSTPGAMEAFKAIIDNEIQETR